MKSCLLSCQNTTLVMSTTLKLTAAATSREITQMKLSKRKVYWEGMLWNYLGGCHVYITKFISLTGNIKTGHSLTVNGHILTCVTMIMKSRLKIITEREVTEIKIQIRKRCWECVTFLCWKMSTFPVHFDFTSDFFFGFNNSKQWTNKLPFLIGQRKEHAFSQFVLNNFSFMKILT